MLTAVPNSRSKPYLEVLVDDPEPIIDPFWMNVCPGKVKGTFWSLGPFPFLTTLSETWAGVCMGGEEKEMCFLSFCLCYELAWGSEAFVPFPLLISLPSLLQKWTHRQARCQPPVIPAKELEAGWIRNSRSSSATRSGSETGLRQKRGRQGLV